VLRDLEKPAIDAIYRQKAWQQSAERASLHVEFEHALSPDGPQ
jgi:hypothetical protein